MFFHGRIMRVDEEFDANDFGLTITLRCRPCLHTLSAKSLNEGTNDMIIPN